MPQRLASRCFYGPAAATALVLVGCATPQPGQGRPVDAGLPTVGDSDSEGSTGGDAGSESDEAPAMTDSGERLDVAPTVEQEEGCQKIDFLFVIDDSASMEDEQARLVAGVPGFMAAVGAAIEQYDYHVMVVTTAELDEMGLGCDATIGAGRVASADRTDCGLQDGARYATVDDDDVLETFGCIADVGIEGDGDEKPMWAMTQAVTTEVRQGGCNEGFLRDDAVLVVTLITDEEDSNDSPGYPELWREVLVSAKHGDDEAIAMLALIGDTDLAEGICEDSGGTLPTGAQASPRLREVTESLPFGSWASVCLEDYAPFFNEAVEGIVEACRTFVPPG